MNKYEEFNSKKFLILTLVICVAFFIVIARAFQYLPNQDNNQIVQPKVEDINSVSNSSSEEEENATENEATTPTEEEQKAPVEKEKVSQKPSEELENIEDLPKEAAAENAPTEPELTPEEKAEKAFFTAQKYKKEKQYVKALEEYKKISEITNDTATIARSYEEIATIYAIVKRYGTALSYAQKAYNMAPSSSREMLLARLYYKTGDIDKATRRINNVLQRDFSADR